MSTASTFRSSSRSEYSNGANIAASLMLLHPDLLRAAVLFRAMVPFEPEETPISPGCPCFCRLAGGTA